MPIALCICVLFILFMQSVNTAQFLNTTSSPALSRSAGASSRAIDIVFIIKYMHHYNYIKLNLTLKF